MKYSLAALLLLGCFLSALCEDDDDNYVESNQKPYDLRQPSGGRNNFFQQPYNQYRRDPQQREGDNQPQPRFKQNNYQDYTRNPQHQFVVEKQDEESSPTEMVNHHQNKRMVEVEPDEDQHTALIPIKEDHDEPDDETREFDDSKEYQQMNMSRMQYFPKSDTSQKRPDSNHYRNQTPNPGGQHPMNQYNAEQTQRQLDMQRQQLQIHQQQLQMQQMHMHQEHEMRRKQEMMQQMQMQQQQMQQQRMAQPGGFPYLPQQHPPHMQQMPQMMGPVPHPPFVPPQPFIPQPHHQHFQPPNFPMPPPQQQFRPPSPPMQPMHPPRNLPPPSNPYNRMSR